jgi:hypothetical protein
MVTARERDLSVDAVGSPTPPEHLQGHHYGRPALCRHPTVTSSDSEHLQGHYYGRPARGYVPADCTGASTRTKEVNAELAN